MIRMNSKMIGRNNRMIFILALMASIGVIWLVGIEKDFTLKNVASIFDIEISEENRSLMTTGDDPQIIFDCAELYLRDVEIKFFSAPKQPCQVQVYYAKDGENFSFGLLLAKDWECTYIKKCILILMLVWNFGLLYYYKYHIFVLDNFNLLTHAGVRLPDIVQPLGISFFTFRTVSFCLDVYWKTVPVQYNFLNVALYICFFPQISMGPIDKYNDFSSQLNERLFHAELFYDGIKRIIVGWAKKLLISDNIGRVVDIIFDMDAAERTIVMSWVGIFGYLIQLYYDFSGYSDVAIGVGQLFGFRTPENFKYPFISKSVVEYWSRWHITLGTWLKNYLYTPIFRACQDRGIAIERCNVMALIGVWLFCRCLAWCRLELYLLWNILLRFYHC